MVINEQDVWKVVKSISPTFNIDPYFLMGIAQQECQKDKVNPKVYLADTARLEQGFYRRYTLPDHLPVTTEVLFAVSYGVFQVLGQSLRELGWFQEQFKFFGKNEKLMFIHPLNNTHVAYQLDRYVFDLPEQVKTTCRWLNVKANGLKMPDWNQMNEQQLRRVLLAWNGGGNLTYDDEVFERINKLKTIYS